MHQRHAKKSPASSLGRSLINNNNNRNGNGNGKTSSKHTTTVHEEPGWVKLQSVTQEKPLDEFLANAELAGTDFTAQKMSNIKIIDPNAGNTYLLTSEEEAEVLRKQRENSNRLTIPRRPHWDASTTKEELNELEREAFFTWRRSLAYLQENQDLLLTPFERNIEVWRQLWRVIERSDLIVQIVDARNPLMFRSPDLEDYVKEIAKSQNKEKKNLLLVNKADMLTESQRKIWANYFINHGIRFAFFSAFLAKEAQEAQEAQDVNEKTADQPSKVQKSNANDEIENNDNEDNEIDNHNDKKTIDDKNSNLQNQSEFSLDDIDPTEILTIDKLEALFRTEAPKNLESETHVIGLVGYPNVGKSSTINALIGAKCVSVSATPGKTKHFQTIKLPETNIILCDCPGLVFPNFALTRAELVTNGVLPIDQLREYSGPATLLCQRIPKDFLEHIYGISIYTRPIEEGGTGIPTSREFLSSYGAARGFMVTGKGGVPDEARSARIVLKDYVSGKLPYVHPPPPPDYLEDGATFNKELYNIRYSDNIDFKKKSTSTDGSIQQNDNETGLDNLDNTTGIKKKKQSRNEVSYQKAVSAGSEFDNSFFNNNDVKTFMKPTFQKKNAILEGSRGKKHFKNKKKK